MQWLHVFSHNSDAKCTFGSLPQLLEDIRAGADIGVIHQGEIVRRFFPVRQVLIRDGHAYAVVHATIHNILPGKGGAITWETAPEGMVVIYCSNGVEYWNGGKDSVKTHLDWFALTDRIDKPKFLRTPSKPSSDG